MLLPFFFLLLFFFFGSVSIFVSLLISYFVFCISCF